MSLFGAVISARSPFSTLLIVILVVGVLIAVAAPDFLGQQSKTQDSRATQHLVNAYRSGKASAWLDNDKSYPELGSLLDIATK